MKQFIKFWRPVVYILLVTVPVLAIMLTYSDYTNDDEPMAYRNKFSGNSGLVIHPDSTNHHH